MLCTAPSKYAEIDARRSKSNAFSPHGCVATKGKCAAILSLTLNPDPALPFESREANCIHFISIILWKQEPNFMLKNYFSFFFARFMQNWGYWKKKIKRRKML
jgi:hypothetical protein